MALANDDVAIAGRTAGPIDFGSGAGPAVTADSPFVAVFSPASAHRWSRTFPTDAPGSVRWLAADSANNLFLVGNAGGSIDLGAGSIGGNGGQDLFYASFDTQGTPLFQGGYGGPLDDEGMGIAISPAGNVIISGVFRSTVDFGAFGSATSMGNADAYLLQL